MILWNRICVGIESFVSSVRSSQGELWNSSKALIPLLNYPIQIWLDKWPKNYHVISYKPISLHMIMEKGRGVLQLYNFQELNHTLTIQWFFGPIALKLLAMLKVLGLKVFFLWIPTHYQWQVGTNSFKYAWKKYFDDFK